MSSPLTSMDMKRIFDNRSISYVYLACYVAFAYDILLCLSNEIALMWGSRWSLIKFLFFATQYPLLFELILVLYSASRQAIFSYGTFASHSFRPKLFSYKGHTLYVIAVVGCLLFCPAWRLFGTFSSSNRQRETHPPHQCHHHSRSTTLNRLLPAFVAGLTFDSIVFGLTFSRVMRYARSKSTPLLEILFRDGLLYYAILCCSGLAFVILVVTLPAANVNVVGAFAFFIRTITATCVSRIVLNLRSLRPRESSSNEDSDYASKGGSGGEDIQFALTTFRTTVQTVQPRLL
ncbi:hypothetical protein BD410DRAFT_161110 [Rickenella mellea]|uniref:DUF6533 domain-containing protein n=1 Tax=Rickenella mellea TaxID=50990 RepID=A0A4Y7Q8D9_9AGAM|nr:hypothetical protein BD410DRAFT_161110 [Rickenella mellea]